MKQSEIDYFLDGVVVKQQMIESIEGLRADLAKAMQPMFEPIMKPATVSSKLPKIWEQHAYIYEDTTLNVYEKAVLLYLTGFDASWPQTMQQIAKATSMSIASVKRVIKRGLANETIMKHPFESGYLLTKNYK